MKVDTTRFYRIVISTKVKTLNMTKLSIEEVGIAVEKRSKPACQTGTLYTYEQNKVASQKIVSNILFFN